MSDAPDTLVLLFTRDGSLRTWAATGMLSREWALYQRLLDHVERLVLVTYGSEPDEQAVLASVAAPACLGRIALIAGEGGHDVHRFLGEAPARAAAACLPGRAVVKSNQMAGGELGIPVRAAMRARGIHAALVARGGYQVSLFAEHEYGVGSPRAREAASREGDLCRAADAVVATTGAMAGDLVRRHGLDARKVEVIPNYVLTHRAPAAPYQRAPGLILYAGQLVARKRVDVLVRAVALLPPDLRQRVTLEIAGEGPERRGLQALAAQTRAPVRFVPRMPHDDLLARMADCAIYVQASELEGHPKTVLEAMAAGCPVVVADAPGLREVVVHGRTGLCVPADPPNFSRAVESLLGDEEKRTSLGESAAEHVRAELSLDLIVPRELAVYRAALARAIGAGFRRSA